eukprot:TRINITY_DN71205_c0_g1_i1.p1 TRINITY_DN71205_c0_g1~~TRINITY_DN71205_c0_g1_i1.p1  ORF type:complete len:482 (+),score=58.65 TRINITY_DN71205_c0_g1_i1:44-1447(+)
MTTLRALDSVPDLGKFFLLTMRSCLTETLMKEGAKHPRMFKMHLGPRTMVVATHPQVARSILTRPDDFEKGFDNRRRIADILNRTKEGKNASLVMANGKEWMAMRKPLDPAFEKQALRHLVPKFIECSDLLLDSWSGKDVVDAKQDMSRFALDVLGSAVLGRSFGAIDGSFHETYEHYKYVMVEGLNPLYMTFPWLEKLPLSRNRKLKASVEHMYDVLKSAVDARIEQRKQLLAAGEEIGEADDMLDLLLGPGLNPSGVVEDGYLLPILWIFFIAGHDTTAISLTWLMQVLAQYPEIQRRCREEALQVMANDTKLDADALDNVPYISAVINEGLRLRPPVYNLITRQAARGTELDGVSIPKGTGISIHIGAINRHPDVWDRPGEFDPARFMQQKQPRIFNNLPFSAGPRRCLGDKFSLMEQKTLLIKLLTRYEVLPANGAQSDEFSSDALSIVFMQPPNMDVVVKSL